MALPLNKKAERNSAIELLRLICIFFIVVTHAVTYVEGAYSVGVSVNKIILAFLRLTGGISDILFVLISGYFLVNSKFSIVRTAKFILEVWFYSIAIYTVMCCTHNADFSLGILFSYVFPFTSGHYWFMTAYLIMSFISPFLNVALKTMGRRGHFYLIITLLVFFSVIPTAIRIIYAASAHNITLPTELYSAPFFFLILYSIGAYIRLYGIKIPKIKAIAMAASGILIQLIIVAALYAASVNNGVSCWDVDLFWETFSSFQVFSALGIFLFVINAKPWTNRAVNLISGGVLGVYILHGTPCVSDLLWLRTFSFDVASPIYLFAPYVLAVAAAICIVALSIDLARRFLIERPLFAALSDKIERVWERITSVFTKDNQT